MMTSSLSVIAMPLSLLPIEVFIDNVLPFCAIPDILSLGCTNRFFALLISDNTFWRRKLDEDFNFNAADTARTIGYKFIYKRLSNPRVFVWGEKANGRLGVDRAPKVAFPPNGIPFPVELAIPNIRIVSLLAGGMSFHALDSTGGVWVWGTLNGSYATSLSSDGFSEAAKSASTPLKLQLPAPTRRISCGRLHSMTLDINFHIWTFLNWGRPFRLVSPLLDCQSSASTPAQIECGWNFSSVLTKSGDVFVYWPFQDVIKAIYDEKMSELDGDTSTKAHAQGNLIPCFTWDLQIDPMLLPPLPRLPDLRDTELDEATRAQETKLIKIAGMESSLVGLTNKGHVLIFNGLSRNDLAGSSEWQYLPLFSEVDKVKMHPVFATAGEKAAGVKFDSKYMCITHISANFKTFIAYSTGSTSIVLMGSDETNSRTQAKVIPELQQKSIISVVLGDYHYGALTSSGKLLTWGQFSRGSLGLGDPTKLEPGTPGGFATEAQHNVMHHLEMPPDVEVPAEVRFDHNLTQKRERFCFAASAAGWHMGALVIDMEDGAEEEIETVALFPSLENRRAWRGRGRGGAGIFRVGLAGGLAGGRGG